MTISLKDNLLCNIDREQEGQVCDLSPDETLALAKALKVTPERTLEKPAPPAKPLIGLGLAPES